VRRVAGAYTVRVIDDGRSGLVGEAKGEAEVE
jgi:hypothetical protein